MVIKEYTMFPSLLDSWLETPIFENERKCQEHNSQYETFYCYVCREEPVCHICWKNSIDQHKDHESSFLQVFSCSRRTSVPVEDIKKLWDVSEIQPYIVNEKQVLYLDSKKAKKKKKKGKNIEQGNCEICSRQVLDSSKFRFCSITCKIKMMERVEEHPMPLIVERSMEKVKEYSMPVNPELSMEKAEEPVLPMSDPPVEMVSYRKRKRKGIPVRSPFF